MKKTLLIFATALAIVACSKEETVRQTAPEAIGFDNAFVENSTRSVVDPSLTAETLDDFAVFGYVEGAVLFDGTCVAKQDLATDQTKTGWEYEGTQYWIAGANYNFNAVAPLTNGGWTKIADGTNKDDTKLSFTNNGTTDLLYAYTTQEGMVSNNEAVDFTFRHVLSKVKFSFENGYNATNATIRVKDIVITNPHKTANVVLDDATAWSDNATAEGFTLAFGMATDAEDTTNAKEDVEVDYAYGATYESHKELFLIPSKSYAYNVTFTVELLVSKTKVATYSHTATVTFAPVAGNAYDIKTVINAQNIDPNHAQEPIEFTVNTLPGWVNTTGVDSVVENNNQ